MSAPARFRCVFVSRNQADFSDPDAPVRALSGCPDAAIVVNATGYTAVDRAESEEVLARTVNGAAVGALAASCAARRLPLIHVSTDYVFDGTGPAPYTEAEPVAPINAYGRSKLEGEDKIRAALVEHVILRTAWVYSPFRANFVKTMLRLGVERDELKVVDDQLGSPTAAADIAEAILDIASRIADRRPVWGTFHYSGGGITSWCKFAGEIFRQAQDLGWPVKAQLTPIATSAYPTPARRPQNSSLNCDKVAAAYGVRQKPWPEALARVLVRLKEEQNQ